MNVTQLHKDCKKEARKCFEHFKHHIRNYPFSGEIDIEGVIRYEIKQEFGRSVLKNHITGNESDIQLQKIQETVSSYESILIETSKNWAVKYIDSQPDN